MEHCDWLLSWIIFGRAPFVGKIRLGLRDYIYMSFCPIFLRRKENDLAVFSSYWLTSMDPGIKSMSVSSLKDVGEIVPRVVEVTGHILVVHGHVLTRFYEAIISLFLLTRHHN